MDNGQRQAIHILLVEDDEDDALLIEKTLNRDRIVNSFDWVHNGEEAMRYLRKETEFSNARRPDLILLDLNMPRMDGRQVLGQCSKDEALAAIPIVVFTSSDDERDILSSYKSKARSYVTKPVDLMKFREVLNEIESYWFCIVKLPPK